MNGASWSLGKARGVLTEVFGVVLASGGQDGSGSAMRVVSLRKARSRCGSLLSVCLEAAAEVPGVCSGNRAYSAERQV